MNILALGVWAVLIARALSPGPAAQQLAPALEALVQGCSCLLGLIALALARREGLLGWRLPLAVTTLASLVALRAFFADTPQEAGMVARAWFADLALIPALALVASSAAGRRLLLAGILATALCASLMALDEYCRLRPALRAALPNEPAPPGVAAAHRQALLDRLHTSEASGPYALPASLAGATLLALPAAAVLVAARLGLAARIAGAILASALVCGLWVSQVRGAFLALGLSLLVLPWRTMLSDLNQGRPRRFALALCAVGAASLLLLLACAWRFPLGREDRAAAASGAVESHLGVSAAVRLEYWIAAGRMLRDAPLAGVGPGLYAARYGAYRPARSEAVRRAHNAAIDFAASYGIAGLGVLATLGALLWAGGPDARPSATVSPGGEGPTAPIGSFGWTDREPSAPSRSKLRRSSFSPAEAGRRSFLPLILATTLSVALVVELGVGSQGAAFPGAHVVYALPAGLIFLGLYLGLGERWSGAPGLLPALGLGILALWLHAQIDQELYGSGLRLLAFAALALVLPAPVPRGRARAVALLALLSLAFLVWPLFSLAAAERQKQRPWSALERTRQVRRMLTLAGDRVDAPLARRLLTEARGLAPHEPLRLAEVASLLAALDGPKASSVRDVARSALEAQRRQRSNQPRLDPDVQAWCESLATPEPVHEH